MAESEFLGVLQEIRASLGRIETRLDHHAEAALRDTARVDGLEARVQQLEELLG
jgi:hypothetical protein